MKEPSSSPGDRRAGLSAALLRAGPALALALGLSLPWLGSELFLDDWHVLWKAHEAQWTWAGLGSGFTFLDPSSISSWNLPALPAYHYFRPLVVAILKLSMALWGLAPQGFHALTISLHLGSILLLGVLAARLSNSERVGRLAALLFAVQPHNIASTLWTAGLTGSLGVFLMLSAIVSYLIARQEKRRAWALAAMVFSVLACLAKEDAVLIGVVVAAWELSRVACGFETFKEWARQGLPTLGALAVLLVSFAAYRLFLFDPMGRLGEPYLMSPVQGGLLRFLGFAFTKLVYYVTAVLTTAPVVPLFGVEFLVGQPWLVVALGLITGFVSWRLLKASLQRGSGRGLTLVAAIWVLASFLPTLPILASDLYIYFAGAGFSVLLAGALAEPTRGRRVVIAVLLALYAFGYTGRGLLFHAQGAIEATVVEDIERSLGGPAPQGTHLLLVNMPISASHVAPHLRLRAGHGDVRASLVTISHEWTTPKQAGPVTCAGARRVTLLPPPELPAFFETPEEWSMQLFRVPLVPGRRYETSFGYSVEPQWTGGRATSLTLDFDEDLGGSGLHVYSFFEDAQGRIAHPHCMGEEGT